MSRETNNKTVLITGTSTGIGRATALHLDQLGFNVIGTVRKQRDASDLEASSSSRLCTLMLDVADNDSIARFQQELSQILGHNGSLWGLVNNAGVGFTSPLEFVPLGEMRWLFDVNFFGLLAVTQVCLPYLRQAQGRVVNISSVASIAVAPFHGPYSASKSGLNTLSSALRLELRPFNVQVSVMICGVVETPIWETGGELAGHIWEGQPDLAVELYGTRYAQLGRYFQLSEESGIPADKAAEIIAKALTSKRAKHTYYIGRDAQSFRLFNKLVPDRLRDWITLRVIGLDT